VFAACKQSTETQEIAEMAICGGLEKNREAALLTRHIGGDTLYTCENTLSHRIGLAGGWVAQMLADTHLL